MCIFTYLYVLCLGSKAVAYYDEQASAVRHMDCLWLCDSRKAVNLCVNCHHYQRNTLNSALTTENKRFIMISPGRSNARSHTNYRFCSTPKKCGRLTNLHHTVRLQKKHWKDW